MATDPSKDSPALYLGEDDMRLLTKSYERTRARDSADGRLVHVSALSLSAPRLRRELREAVILEQAAQHAVDFHDWQPAAEQLVHQALERARDEQWRNPYSYWTLDRLDAVTGLVVEYMSRAHLRTNARDAWRVDPGLPLRKVRVFYRYVADPTWVSAAIEAEIHRRNKVARLDDYKIQPGRDNTAVIVQHLPTGLRIRLTPDAIATGVGVIEARHYNITSIDLDHPDRPVDYTQWAGLGIGTQLYRRGARHLPAQRWATNAPRPSTGAIRRRLHAEAPYTWHGRCEWCDLHGINWSTATVATYTGHPAPS